MSQQTSQKTQNPNTPLSPLSVVLAEAQKEMMKATNSVMLKFGVPACVMDGIVSSILADIRAQSKAELIRDLQQAPETTSAEAFENHEVTKNE